LQDSVDFRNEVREWLEANCPASMRTPMPDDERVWGGRNPEFKNPDSKVWMDRMVEKGWTAPTWPTKYGGGGLGSEENAILQDELRLIGARPALMSFGLAMLGPVLLEFATEEQRQRYLPGIVRGEIRWCQGYSEPGAGSDLASLQTRAEDKGDHFLVNGHKIWTSYSHWADWIFCLVRTDPTTKHDGISFILFDMESPGVRTAPIILISGVSVFCETFIEDVKVPKENLVGELNKGWTIAKRLLQHERTQTSGMAGGRGGGGLDLANFAKKYAGEQNGKVANPELRTEIARQKINDSAFGLTIKRTSAERAAGIDPSDCMTIFKYYGTEQNMSKYELLIRCLGTQGLGWEGDEFADDELMHTRDWLRTKGNSIEAGTSEINLNVIAKRVLGLPD